MLKEMFSMLNLFTPTYSNFLSINGKSSDLTLLMKPIKQITSLLQLASSSSRQKKELSKWQLKLKKQFNPCIFYQYIFHLLGWFSHISERVLKNMDDYLGSHTLVLKMHKRHFLMLHIFYNNTRPYMLMYIFKWKSKFVCMMNIWKSYFIMIKR